MQIAFGVSSFVPAVSQGGVAAHMASEQEQSQPQAVAVSAIRGVEFGEAR
ncbi:hypothetical protein KOR42_05880 [Thalassoglobus neptunius]|uniref:Uncharacterized protein n=1 Tax=Thalassoglobus neptunius TaxID=1938619 RepID=A0A5C5X328_9PLAN|nr:hypothetical protein KOR42_05880 [Thalassoglobus neptunius]